MLPRSFRGVWRRRSIAFDGGEPFENADVLWLQAAEFFADLRVPLDATAAVEAFAGTTDWRAPRLIWTHTIDWRGGFAGYDCGEIAWSGELMLERGTTGRNGDLHSYEEVWERIDGGVTRLVATAPDAILVHVGAHAIAMRDERERGGPFSVRRARCDAGIWTDADVFGDGQDLPLPDRIPESWRIRETAGLPARV